MAIKLAACVASSLSVATIFGCIVFVPMLWNKVADIQSMVQTDLDEFNVSAFGVSGVRIILGYGFYR